MTRPAFFPDFDALPATVPIFPLTGVLLLPRGPLPLNIFEPRYLAMVDDALATDRLIAMAQPLEPGSRAKKPDVYPIVCGGRVTSYEETDDGRYLITLTGVARCRITDELPTTRGYRRVAVDWSEFQDDLESRGPCALDRDRLEPALERYFQLQGINANWDAIRETEDDRLVTSLAMICPFEAPEKQALLEASTPSERAALLISLVEMAVLSTGPTGAGPQ